MSRNCSFSCSCCRPNGWIGRLCNWCFCGCCCSPPPSPAPPRASVRFQPEPQPPPRARRQTHDPDHDKKNNKKEKAPASVSGSEGKSRPPSPGLPERGPSWGAFKSYNGSFDELVALGAIPSRKKWVYGRRKREMNDPESSDPDDGPTF
ncbi:hypothetical protein EDC01DRAFT_627795 [Geopyxis carbonaria]|nr:hypothetical protein EDC01DRAFT_627795 [Geopyxis carbonaria]